MAETDPPDSVGKPLYVSFATLTNFLDKIGEGAIPPRIDKGVLETYSGGTQALLQVALRTLGLTDAENKTQEPDFSLAARDQEKRKAMVHDRLAPMYAEQIELARQSATAHQLQESFEKHGYKGSTLRKAIVFYLAWSDYTGSPKSQWFKPPKQSTKPSKPRTHQTLLAPKPMPTTPQGGGEGERVTVTLGDAGSVTLIVDVRWLDLPDETFVSLRKITKDLRGLGTILDEAAPEDDEEEDEVEP
jgi:hypothetical protein